MTGNPYRFFTSQHSFHISSLPIRKKSSGREKFLPYEAVCNRPHLCSCRHGTCADVNGSACDSIHDPVWCAFGTKKLMGHRVQMKPYSNSTKMVLLPPEVSHRNLCCHTCLVKQIQYWLSRLQRQYYPDAARRVTLLVFTYPPSFLWWDQSI